MVTTAKQPIQIRLSDEELALLDAYRQPAGRFPPDRPAVVKTALMEWLAQQAATDAKVEGGTPKVADVSPEDDTAERKRESSRVSSKNYRERQKEKKAAG